MFALDFKLELVLLKNLTLYFCSHVSLDLFSLLTLIESNSLIDLNLSQFLGCCLNFGLQIFDQRVQIFGITLRVIQVLTNLGSLDLKLLQLLSIKQF